LSSFGRINYAPHFVLELSPIYWQDSHVSGFSNEHASASASVNVFSTGLAVFEPEAPLVLEILVAGRDLR